MLSPDDARLVSFLHGGFPLSDRPFAEVAAQLGCSEDAVLAVIERMTHAAGLARYPREVLFSTRRFKQTGARRFRGWDPAPTATPWQEVHHAHAR